MSAHRRAVAGLAFVFVLVGVALVVRTIALGGGIGILFGVLFVAAGAGRLWLLRRRSR